MCQNHCLLQDKVARPTILRIRERPDPHQVRSLSAKMRQRQARTHQLRRQGPFTKTARTPESKDCCGNYVSCVVSILAYPFTSTLDAICLLMAGPCRIHVSTFTSIYVNVHQCMSDLHRIFTGLRPIYVHLLHCTSSVYVNLHGFFVNLCQRHGSAMALPWECHGTAMAVQGHCHGSKSQQLIEIVATLSFHE